MFDLVSTIGAVGISCASQWYLVFEKKKEKHDCHYVKTDMP